MNLWLTMLYWHSLDGEMVLIGLRNYVAEIWHLERRKRMSFLRHQGAVNCGAFASNSQWVASDCRDGTLRLWDPKTGLVFGPRLRDLYEVTSLVIEPADQRLYTN